MKIYRLGMSPETIEIVASDTITMENDAFNKYKHQFKILETQMIPNVRQTVEMIIKAKILSVPIDRINHAFELSEDPTVAEDILNAYESGVPSQIVDYIASKFTDPMAINSALEAFNTIEAKGHLGSFFSKDKDGYSLMERSDSAEQFKTDIVTQFKTDFLDKLSANANYEEISNFANQLMDYYQGQWESYEDHTPDELKQEVQRRNNIKPYEFSEEELMSVDDYWKTIDEKKNL